MAINGKTRNDKLQYKINKEAEKVSALLSDKIDKYGYLTGEEILPSDQSRIIEQGKFTYSPLGKSLEKETKTIKDQEGKQIKAIENKFKKHLLNTDRKSIVSLVSRDFLREEAKCELNKIVEKENKFHRDGLIYKQ